MKRPQCADIYISSRCAEQVGTLDVLVGLSDELAKLDSFVERYALALFVLDL